MCGCITMALSIECCDITKDLRDVSLPLLLYSTWLLATSSVDGFWHSRIIRDKPSPAHSKLRLPSTRENQENMRWQLREVVVYSVEGWHLEIHGRTGICTSTRALLGILFCSSIIGPSLALYVIPRPIGSIKTRVTRTGITLPRRSQLRQPLESPLLVWGTFNVA